MKLRQVPPAVVRMVQLAVLRHEWCWVTPDKKTSGWRHRYREGVIVSPLPRHGSWRHHQRTALDLACYDYVPRPGDTVVEVGAGWGTETVTLAQLVGDQGHVYAVEASPHAADLLSRTVEENGLRNVSVIRLAISNAAGSLVINERGGTGDIKNTAMVSGNGGVAVECVTLDELADRRSIKRIDLLKVNIEGSERFMVAGMQESFSIIRHAMVSCHDFIAEKFGDDSFRTRAEVEAQFRARHFSVVTRPADPTRPWVRDHLYFRGPDVGRGPVPGR